MNSIQSEYFCGFCYQQEYSEFIFRVITKVDTANSSYSNRQLNRIHICDRNGYTNIYKNVSNMKDIAEQSNELREV